MGRIALACCVFALWHAALPRDVAAQDNPASKLEAPAVYVIGTTPLPGIGTPLEQVPANAQSISSRELRERMTPGIADYLGDTQAGFSVSDPQGNPYQSTLSYRGFSASPLLGTPQGISVFVDGVRANEALGDVVNWDLIPRIAISSINVIPGSNPVFGLNTLGGALAIYTKSGFHYPGTAARAYAGSYGRAALELEHGGSHEKNDYYVATSLFGERGWRDHSASRVNQFFGKIGREDAERDLDFSLTLADTSLSGTQALPLSMLGQPRQPYTWPDRTENQLAFANLRANNVLDGERVLLGNVYLRTLSSSTFNSNVNDDCAAGPCAFNAINDSTVTDETRWGVAGQYTTTAPLLGRGNQLSIGISLDSSSARFTGSEQEAYFTSEREAAGVSGYTTRTSVSTAQRQFRVFAYDVLSVTERLALSSAAAYSVSSVRIEDRTGSQPALNGQYRFSRLLPALGATYTRAPRATLYASASTGMRAPTPIELTCADPNAPCRLPSIFLADPPLKPVLARTYEAGARQPLAPGASLSAAVFRTELTDDIQFVSTGGAALNAGYFQNTGRTRRQGAEIGIESQIGIWALAARYARVNATYQSAFTVASPANSSADAAGDIQVTPGNRIPGIPRDALKLRAEAAFGTAGAIAASMVYFSGQYARGDENNRDLNGQVPGYAVINLEARWSLGGGWQIQANIANLFDRRYASFGTLGQNFFTGPGNSFDAANTRAEQFRTPGAPVGVWVGIAYRPRS